MVRRSPHVLALVAVLLVWSPTAAFAAYSATIVQPAGQERVVGPIEIRVRVSRDFADTAVTALRVRPADGRQLRPTTCISECGPGDTEPVFAFELDPRTGAPFGEGPLPNGPLEFEGIVSRELGEDRSVGTLTLNLRVPGSAVGGLAATAEDDTVRLAWSRAPEPDILGYRIERCAGACDAAGDWSGRADVAPSASAFIDAPGAGTSSYRVVTIRDGGGDGSSIETVSAPVAAEVVPANPPDGPVDADEVDDRDGAGADDRDGDDAQDTPADAEGGARSDRDERDATTPVGPSRPGRPRSSRPPAVSLGPAGARIPELSGPDDVFRGALDYSGGDQQTGAAATEGDEVVLSSPSGGGGSFLGALGDRERVAVPLASGLLVTAIGLHLRRWLRVPLS